MGVTLKMLDTPFKSKLMHKISHSFLSYAKCSYWPPLDQESSAPHFSRDLILFFCRLLKNMPQNQSFVSNYFGASDYSAAGSLSSRGTSAGRLTRTAFTRFLISFFCRLPKIHALNHSVVSTRFGASDSSPLARQNLLLLQDGHRVRQAVRGGSVHPDESKVSLSQDEGLTLSSIRVMGL
jgi:hypothetical protein